MRRALLALVALLLAGCALNDVAPPDRVALLAPFEGRYREIGYAALYPAQMAVAAVPGVDLLPVDDGGSVATALERARALRLDPRVRAVVIQGYAATDPAVLRAFDDLPVIVVGDWGADPVSPSVVILSSAEIAGQLDPALRRLDLGDAAASDGVVGEVGGLTAFRALHADPASVTVVSSGAPPDAAFRDEVLASAEFAVVPNHLGALTYDAVTIAATHSGPLDAVEVAGLSGRIAFEGGYWGDAPVNEFPADALP